MSDTKEKEFMSFIGEVLKLRPIEFIGLANLLLIDLSEDNKPKDAESILSEILDKYIALSHKKQKELLKIVKKANKGGKKNGYGAKTAKEKDVSSQDV